MKAWSKGADPGADQPPQGVVKRVAFWVLFVLVVGFYGGVAIWLGRGA